jgi:hypothetical protein
MCGGVFIVLLVGSLTHAQELTKQAKDRIAQTLKQSSSTAATGDNKTNRDSGHLFLFNHDGELQDTMKEQKDELKGYNSLQGWLKSDKSPVGSCKDPKPTPPPGCVMCDNGSTVCAKGFDWSGKSANPSN